jgi:hypothetical protein
MLLVSEMREKTVEGVSEDTDVVTNLWYHPVSEVSFVRN